MTPAEENLCRFCGFDPEGVLSISQEGDFAIRVKLKAPLSRIFTTIVVDPTLPQDGFAIRMEEPPPTSPDPARARAI